MKILIITDAWHPQVSGVVRTLTSTIEELHRRGHQTKIISPDKFKNLPCPTYPQIRLAVPFDKKIPRILRTFQPDAIHIATEGPLGLYGRIFFGSKNIPFTTSFTTKFPEYIYDRFKLPPRMTYLALRWFHGKSRRVLVSTLTMKKELSEKGFKNIVIWSRGVDRTIFYPRGKNFLKDKRPILLYAGRVAVEKNIEDFLSLDMEGTKYLVGDGPHLDKLKKKYPFARFVGAKHGEELAQYYSAADLFVFPSLTDTFGLVMIEALACGVPIAAYPVTGPLDVIGDSGVGVLNSNLAVAARKALKIPSETCVEFSKNFSWERSAHSFLQHLQPIEKTYPQPSPIPKIIHPHDTDFPIAESMGLHSDADG